MKHIKFLIGLLMLFLVRDLHGQYNGNYWAFGDSALLNFSNPNNPIAGSSSFTFRNGSASIADSNGLLLYTGYNYNLNPVRPSIWNKFNLDITDSGRINGGLWYHSSQFVPDPGNDSLIYLFTIGVTSGERYGFSYSVINYKANNDSGVVIQKNVQLNNYPAFDALMSVRHGNGRDWWVFSQRWYDPSGQIPTNEFNLYLISPSGINGPFIQNIGSTHATNLGHLVFSSQGDNFVNLSIRGLIELYNFDRCTGIISSTIPIEQEPVTGPYVHIYTTCALSPDDSKLYIIDLDQTTLTYYLLQYDLMASNIAASKFIIDSIITPAAPWQMKLAPDGKIYITAFDENYNWPYPDTITAYTTINNNLSVINFPDSLGTACDFQPFSFNLGTGRSYYGLPNNPDYELGAWVGSPCDTLSVGLPSQAAVEASFFQAWYNREWDLVHVNATGLKGRTGRLRLFDLEGRLVYEKKIEVIPGGYVTTEIGMQGLANGLYIVSLVTEKEIVSAKVKK
ncbi:MAG: hypothetical protein JNL88_13620 [Bacteroidia bacterium]|nr:hypothetical protein [Bacteroidia bacterium]